MISPLEAPPQGARSSLPSYCLVPVSNLAEDFRKAGASQMSVQFPVTPSIPGFAHVSFKALELMFTLAVERPKNLTCDVWEQAASQVPHFGLHELPWKLIEASVMLVKRESFLGG